MNRLSIALKKVRRDLNRIKACPIYAYSGFNRRIIVFDEIIGRYDDPDMSNTTQKDIDEGYYKSIEHFDSLHTADVEYWGEYKGSKILSYREKTRQYLIELAKVWRKRVESEHPDANIVLIVHWDKEDSYWCLDTYNHSVTIEGGIYF